MREDKGTLLNLRQVLTVKKKTLEHLPVLHKLAAEMAMKNGRLRMIDEGEEK